MGRLRGSAVGPSSLSAAVGDLICGVPWEMHWDKAGSKNDDDDDDDDDVVVDDDVDVHDGDDDLDIDLDLDDDDDDDGIAMYCVFPRKSKCRNSCTNARLDIGLITSPGGNMREPYTDIGVITAETPSSCEETSDEPIPHQDPYHRYASL